MKKYQRPATKALLRRKWGKGKKKKAKKKKR